MARSCSVCSHPERVSIEKSGASFRDIAGQFGLSESAVRRHKNEHVHSNDQSTQEPKHSEANQSNEPTQEPTQSIAAQSTHSEVRQSNEVQEQSTHPPVNENEVLHREIIAYIQSKLEPELAALYSDAIEQSVGSNCYDHEFKSSAGPYLRIERYIGVLRDDWLKRQGDIQPLVYRILRLLSFGSSEQKEQLRRLLDLK